MAQNMTDSGSAYAAEPIKLDSIESALADFREGRMVVVVDE